MEHSRVPCALFPLPVMPLPGEQLHLHIFEPRYRDLFDRLESMELTEFGIPHLAHGKPSGAGGLMRLLYVERRLPDGRRDVVVECTGLFRIDPELPSTPEGDALYPIGDIAPIAGWRTWNLPDVHSVDSDSPTPREGVWMARVRKLPLGPEQRAALVLERSERRRNALLQEALRLHELVSAQERQRSGPWFPN